MELMDRINRIYRIKSEENIFVSNPVSPVNPVD
jgi:hypothetical protein